MLAEGSIWCNWEYYCFSLKVSAKIWWKRKRKHEERSASTLAERPLSLPVPCGLMPRTWSSPRPSCPMVQLIICSATRKLMLAYASLCLHNCRVSRPEPQREGGLTDWLGIRGLGLDLKMSGPLRNWASTPFCPPPSVSPSVQVLLRGCWPRWLCGQRPCWPTQTLTLLPLSRETKTLKGSVCVS